MVDELRPPPTKLSIIIACLNAEQTLGQQLTALAAQPQSARCEVIIADNGSTDGSLLIARSHQGRLPLRIVDASAVRGPGAARNVAAQQAHGEWLAFCDADDIVAADWISEMSAALAEHQFVAGRFESRRLNDGRVLRSRPLDQQDGLQCFPGSNAPPHAGAGNMGIHRALFLAAGGFDPTIACLEDTDFSWRVQQSGIPLVFAPDVVVHVRLRSSLVTMYRQGRDYGDAHDLLERRYRFTDTNESQPMAKTEPARRQGRLRAARGVAKTWLGAEPSLGHAVWQVGWHVGHRWPKHAPEAAGLAAPRSLTSSG